jgi:hypothetical protein
MMSFRLPGWGGVLQTNLLVEQQRLPCQAGLQPHSRGANNLYVRRLTTRRLVFRIY